MTQTQAHRHTGTDRHAPLVGPYAEVEIISVENDHHVLQQHLVLLGIKSGR